MARYTGPKHRLARREGENILDKTSPSLLRRLNVPVGMHAKARRRRLSEYGQQLREKQKVKATYGMLEKQFKGLVQKAQVKKGNTEEALFSLLERRLDNLVYRLGFAKTRTMARQFVSHGHVLVGGKKMTIPSYCVKAGEAISLSEKIKKTPDLLKLSEDEKQLVSFVKLSKNSGEMTKIPSVEDMDIPFNLRLIIEYYSR